MLRKGVLIATLIFVSLLWCAPAAVEAQEVTPPFNPVCWKKIDCTNARAQIAGKSLYQLTDAEQAQIGDGWIQGAAPCYGDEWGKCLPANVTITNIAIAGKTKFLNIGDYIQTIYRFILGIVGILAAAMIVIAGAQWATAGGNAETLTSAKHRIVNSVIGMFLAFSSYLILSTLDPALVNLRLPQVYLIRPNNLVPKYCSAAPQGMLFMLAASKDNQSAILTVPTTTEYTLAYGKLGTIDSSNPNNENMSMPDLPQSEYQNYSGDAPVTNQKKNQVIYDSKQFECGKRFYMQNGGSLTCTGDWCPAGNVCVDYGGTDPKNPVRCIKGVMAGQIGGDVGGITGIQIDNNLELSVMCKNGEVHPVSKIDVNNDISPHQYLFENVDESTLKRQCGGLDNIAGFYLDGELNDETGGTGGFLEGANLFGLTSWGLDDWHIIGQEAPHSGACDVNLAILGNSLLKAYPLCGNQKTYAGCSEVFFGGTPADFLKPLATDPKFISHLISYEELQSGYRCDLTLRRGEFPAMDITSDPRGSVLKIYSPVDVLKENKGDEETL